MKDIPLELAVRLPAIHEAGERQEVANVLSAGLGDELGVRTRDWPSGLWSVRCSTEPHHPPGNQVLGVKAERLDDLRPLLEWFDEAGCALHVRLPGPAIDGAPGPRLFELGFAPHELEAWLAAPTGAFDVEAVDHEVHEVTTVDRLPDFGAAFCAGWGLTDERRRRMALAAMAPWPTPDGWRRYVAYVDGHPAAEALLVQAGEVAYLAEAATDERFRRLGLHRALIARRAADARVAGATVLFGCALYGDQSWANMRALGLKEAFLTLSFKRPPAGRGTELRRP